MPAETTRETTRETALAVQRPPRMVGMLEAFSCPAMAFRDNPPAFSRPTSGMTRLAKAADAAALPAHTGVGVGTLVGAGAMAAGAQAMNKGAVATKPPSSMNA